MRNLGWLLVLAACGGGGSDGPADAPVAPAMVTISGTASSRGLGGATPEQGVTVAAYASSDENTPLAMTTTDAAGAFSLTITTTGTAIEGYLKASKSGLLTSYLYPPTAISGDLTMVPMNMLKNFDALETLTQVTQAPGKGLVAMIVVGGAELTSPPVMGATVSSSPSSMQYRYNGSNGLPSSSAMATAADGLAFAMNAPVGPITVSASKSGSTFKSTTLKAQADAFTQTLIIQ